MSKRILQGPLGGDTWTALWGQGRKGMKSKGLEGVGDLGIWGTTEKLGTRLMIDGDKETREIPHLRQPSEKLVCVLCVRL